MDVRFVVAAVTPVQYANLLGEEPVEAFSATVPKRGAQSRDRELYLVAAPDPQAGHKALHLLRGPDPDATGYETCEEAVGAWRRRGMEALGIQESLLQPA